MKCRGCDNTVPPAKGPGRKKEWCSDRCRKRTLYTIPCEKCGAPCGGVANMNSSGLPSRHCTACAREITHKKARQYGDAVRSELSALWLEGHSICAIAQIMELTPGSANAAVSRYRSKGYESEFPLRRNMSIAARQRIAEAAKRTRALEPRSAAA